MILLLDNYDSFVHNLARHFERLGQTTCVIRSDAIDAQGVAELRPQAVVISPGPCTPTEAGCSLDVVRKLTGTVPILGVCLGHQAIAAAMGGRVIRAPEPFHGRASLVQHGGKGLFTNLPDPLRAGRYHSLVVDRQSLPRDLVVTATTSDGVVMAVAHRHCPLFGVQFHPESILTEYGYELLSNFLKEAGISQPRSTPNWRDEHPAVGPSRFELPSQPVTF
jgi:anthranilate synthase/aminodeoxychorismate synthase-like glutamine amidotransferase